MEQVINKAHQQVLNNEEFASAQITELLYSLGDLQERIKVTLSPFINFWDYKGAQWWLLHFTLLSLINVNFLIFYLFPLSSTKVLWLWCDDVIL